MQSYIKHRELPGRYKAMSRHQRIWIEAVLWVVAEIILSSSALDTLADYTEFLVNQKMSGAPYTQIIAQPKIG